MTYQEEYASFFERLSQYPNPSLLQDVFYKEDIALGIKELITKYKYIHTKEDRAYVNK